MHDPQDTVQHLEQGFEVAEWRVLPHSNSIEDRRRPGSGHRKRLNSKSIQVLVLLASHSGRFVSKDEILSTIWAGRIVTEDVLTGAISTLRRAMDDDARDPHIIETRKGAGYRLIADVGPVPPPGPHYRRWAIVGAATAAIMVLAALLVHNYGSDNKGYVTVAVLPFINLSEDTRGTYLASAMTEALILHLAKRDRLRVISRTSVLPYADQTKSVPVIARELGADYVVEGSVLADQAQLRITAQLIDPGDDVHLWASAYDRPLNDILALQQEVANDITHKIIGVVVEEPAKQARVLPADALDRLLKARYLLAQETAHEAQQALELFQALGLEYPEMAEAHLGAAQTQLLLFKQHVLPLDALTAAHEAVNRAIELDGGGAEVYRCLAQILFFKDWDFTRSEASYKKAIDLNPSDTVARRRYAWLLVSLQRYEEALEQIAQARLVDPHYYTSADGAMLLLFAGQHAEAAAELERLNAIEPHSTSILRLLSVAYWGLGRLDESTSALIDSREAAGIPRAQQDELRAAFEQEGRSGVYRYLIAAEEFTSPVAKAGFHAQLGDRDSALDWLERAISDRDPEVPFVHARPEFAGLHDDERFQALLGRIKYTP